MTTLTPLTALPLAALLHVVQHLPAPVVITDPAGFVIGTSPQASLLLGSRSGRDVHLDQHLATSSPEVRVTQRSSIESEDGQHHLVGLADHRMSPMAPPKDVAALAGAVAHDFNNLLGVIINFASLAAAGVPPGSAAADDLREVLAASQRAATIANRLKELGDVRSADRFSDRI